MSTVARLETLFLQIAFWLSLMLGGLALLLTVSGLFSVLDPPGTPIESPSGKPKKETDLRPHSIRPLL